jgi:hypothetical protein
VQWRVNNAQQEIAVKAGNSGKYDNRAEPDRTPTRGAICICMEQSSKTLAPSSVYHKSHGNSLICNCLLICQLCSARPTDNWNCALGNGCDTGRQSLGVDWKILASGRIPTAVWGCSTRLDYKITCSEEDICTALRREPFSKLQKVPVTHLPKRT